MSEKPTVFEAVAAVARDVGAVGKNARHKKKFSYRRVDDVIGALHGPMVDHGLVIVPHLVEHDMVPFGGYSSSGEWVRHTVTMEYHVFGPEGDALPVPVRVVADGLDDSDHGPGKAAAYALKLAMGELFMLPFDDDRMDNEATPPPEPEPISPEQQQLADRLRALPELVQPNAADWLRNKGLSLKHPLSDAQLDEVEAFVSDLETGDPLDQEDDT